MIHRATGRLVAVGVAYAAATVFYAVSFGCFVLLLSLSF